MAKHTYRYPVDVTFYISGETDMNKEDFVESDIDCIWDEEEHEKLMEEMRRLVKAYDDDKNPYDMLQGVDIYHPCAEGCGFKFDGEWVD